MSADCMLVSREPVAFQVTNTSLFMSYALELLWKAHAFGRLGREIVIA